MKLSDYNPDWRWNGPALVEYLDRWERTIDWKTDKYSVERSIEFILNFLYDHNPFTELIKNEQNIQTHENQEEACKEDEIAGTNSEKRQENA